MSKETLTKHFTEGTPETWERVMGFFRKKIDVRLEAMRPHVDKNHPDWIILQALEMMDESLESHPLDNPQNINKALDNLVQGYRDDLKEIDFTLMCYSGAEVSEIDSFEHRKDIKRQRRGQQTYEEAKRLHEQIERFEEWRLKDSFKIAELAYIYLATHNNISMMIDRFTASSHMPKTEHQQFVAQLNEYAPPPQELIDAGVHPFKVWRSEFDVSINEMAKKLGIDIEKYIAIETGLIEPLPHEYIDFCAALNLMPTDLIDDRGVMTDGLCEAAYTMMRDMNPKDKPYQDLYRFLRVQAGHVVAVKLFEVIKNRTDGITTQQTINKLAHALLVMDGDPFLQDFRNLDFIVDECISEADNKQSKLQREADKSNKKNEKARKRFETLGQKLYRGAEGLGAWAHVSTALELLRRGMRNDEKFLALYEHHPQTIGSLLWPKKTTKIVFEGKKIGSWEEAHKIHVGLYRDALQTQTASRKAFLSANQAWRQADNIARWVYDHQDVLQRFKIRQWLIGKPEFADLASPDTAIKMQRVTSHTHAVLHKAGVKTLSLR